VLVCAVDDVPAGEGRSVSVDGRKLALFRTDAGVFALDATCPHKGGPLADGLVADRCVTCPLHGKRFDLETGATADGEFVVATHEVRVDDGEVFVRLSA
jgi:nitrite reductase (NADH) small subunit